MKSILASIATFGIVAVLLGAGTFAYFTDTETSTDNLIEAGTIDFQLAPDSGSAIWTMADMKPNFFTMNSLILENLGMNDGDHVEIMVDNTMNDPDNEPSDTMWDAATDESGNPMDQYLQLIDLGYHTYERVAAIVNTADHLVSTQNPDGGWPWYDNGGASTTNTLGVTGMGVVLGLYLDQDNPTFLNSIEQAYQYALARGPGWGGDVVDSAPDHLFHVLCSQLTGDGKYANLAKDRYEYKKNSYGDYNGDLDVTIEDLGQKILDVRYTSHRGLGLWDNKLFIESLMALGTWFCGEQDYFYGDADILAELIHDQTIGTEPYFDYNDPTMAKYVLGLCGLIQSYMLTNNYLAEAETVASLLIAQQNSDGSWSDDDNVESFQNTAYAVSSLMVYAMMGNLNAGVTQVSIDDAVEAAQKGADWFVRNQESGGYWYDPVDGDNLEVDGEAATAIFWAGSLLYRIQNDNGNQWYDLDDLENTNEADPVDIDNLPTIQAGQANVVTMKVRFHPLADNGMQGDETNMLMTFYLEQHNTQ